MVVVATSDAPALARVKGASLAMSIANSFAPRKVFPVMDSVTRYAMAQGRLA